MKSDRLLSILLLLQTRGRVSAPELAERLEVSPRTIYRDVEALSASGVPVYAERGRNGGISLLPGFRTDVTGLTTDEARALFVLAAQGAHSALGLEGALGSALRKVMAALPAPHRPAAELTSRRILVDPGGWRARAKPGVDLDVLHTGVFADRRLRIRYRHGGTAEHRTYTVDPYGLVNKADTWYLVADRQGEPYPFRADRVAAATVTDIPVRRRPGVELTGVWEELRRWVEEWPDPVHVTARVRRVRLDMFLRVLGSNVTDVTEDEPGEWVPVRLAFPLLPAVNQLLQFTTWVEVLDPPEARAELARRAASVQALYEDTTAPDAPTDPAVPEAPEGAAEGPSEGASADVAGDVPRSAPETSP